MATTSEIQVTEAYIGLLGRAPDPAGLAYWVAELDALIAAGQDPAVALKKLTNDITLSDEWDAGIGANDASTVAGSEAIVTAMYENLFDRTPPSQTELDYWAPKLVSGEFTASEMAVALIEGAPAGGTDSEVMTYKQEAATYYVESVGDNHSNTAAAASVVDVNGPITLADSKTSTDYVASGVGETTALTTGADTVAMTAGSDTVTGTSGTGATFAAGDNITDASTVDSDTLTITGDDDFDFGTVSNVENINVSLSKQLGGGFDIDAANLTGGDLSVTVSPTVEISGVTVTGETVLGVTNLSSNISTTSVTNLDVDLDGEAATVTVDSAGTTVTVSSIDSNDTTISLGNDTATALNISGGANTNDAASISGAGTVTLDVSEGGSGDVEVLSLSGSSNDVNFDISGVTTSANMQYTTTGDNAVTLTGAAGDFDDATFTMGATTALDVDTAGDLGLTGQGVFAGGIDLSVNMGGTDTIDLQGGNTITISVDQDAADILNIDAANDTTADSVTLLLDNDAGELETANFETVTITTGATAKVIDEIDMSDNDAAVAINGAGAITVTGTTGVGSIDIDGGNNVTLTGAVTSAGTTEVEGDAITTIGAGITSTNDVTLIGDSIAVTGTVAAANGDVTATATNDVSVGVTTATLGSVDIDGAAITSVGAITAQNDIEITGTGTITLGANAVNTTGAGGSNTISISGTDMPDVGAIGSATTRDITIAMSNDAVTSDLDGAVTASNSITLSDGKFDATGVTLTAESVLITGDTDFLAGSVVAEALTITSTNDVTITAIGENVAGEGAVLSGASATGDIDVTVAGTSTGTMTIVTGAGDDTVVMNEAAVINVNSGEGNDSITITDSSAGSVINTGGGDDTVDDNETVANVLSLGDGNDTYTPLATSTSSVDFGDGTGDTVMAGGLTIGQTNYSNLEIMNVTGGTTISYLLLDNDATFKVTGAATLTVDGTGAGANTTVTLAGLTGDVAALPNTAINGSANADIIIGSEMVDVIDAGAGNDTITLGGSGDTVAYTTGADGIDTIKDFTSGSDKYNTDFATTKNSVGGGTVGGTLASAAGAVTLDATKDVVEITGTLQSTIVDFNNDTQVLAAVSGTSVSITANGNKILMVVYQGGNAYLYEVTEGGDGDAIVGDGDITLVGIFEGIADGGLAPGDII
ncbi:MAG: hypothetical protein CML51_06020 [Rhodobacteraceae bacterium]|nr:hypothetical protein [Paracoccaceae bacterium]